MPKWYKYGVGAVFGLMGIQQVQKRGVERKARDEFSKQQSEIKRQSEIAQKERDRIASDRARSEAKLRQGQARSRRRSVKGGLFGEGQVEQSYNQRLG